MTSVSIDYGRHLAEQREPLTAEQVEAAARVIAAIQSEQAAA